jgi:hypothetical protein
MPVRLLTKFDLGFLSMNTTVRRFITNLYYVIEQQPA